MATSIGVFVIAAMGGWLIAGNAPNGMIREPWRRPLGMLFISARLVLAAMALLGASG
jgi:hypothetical protein